jgi:hypothetical protein
MENCSAHSPNAVRHPPRHRQQESVTLLLRTVLLSARRRIPTGATTGRGARPQALPVMQAGHGTLAVMSLAQLSAAIPPEPSLWPHSSTQGKLADRRPPTVPWQRPRRRPWLRHSRWSWKRVRRLSCSWVRSASAITPPSQLLPMSMDWTLGSPKFTDATRSRLPTARAGGSAPRRRVGAR